MLFLFNTTLLASSFAQQNFQPGFIVKQKGDTIRGFIDYRRWDRNPDRISFRESSTSEPEEYPAWNLKSFFVADEFYEGAIVEVDMSPQRADQLTENPLPVYAKDTIFLLVLVRGNKSLLHFRDASQKDHFYIKSEGYESLVHKEYIIYLRKFRNDEKRVAENVRYKGQLAFYLKDCPGIENKLARTRFRMAELVRLFKNYYACTNESVVYARERQDTKAELGVMAGATLADMNFDYKSGLSHLSVDKSVGQALGFFFDFRLLRANGFKIANDVFYSRINLSAEGTGSAGGLIPFTSHATFKYNLFKSHHMFQFSPAKKNSFYVAGGLALGFLVAKQVEVNRVYATGLTATDNANHRGYELGYVTGLGGSFGKFGLEARFENTTGVIHYSSSTKIHFIVRYKIRG